MAAPIGSLVASKFGLNFPMILSAIPTFFASIIVLSVEEPKYKSKISESRRYIDIVKHGLKTLIKNKELKKLTFNSLFVSSAAYFVIWFYQPLLTDINIPIIYFGFVHSLLVIVEILISSNFQRIENILGSEKKYMLFTIFVTFLGFMLVGIKQSYITVLFFIILSGGFGLTYTQYISVIMQKYIKSKERATVISSFSMFKRFVLVFLNPVVSYFVNISFKVVFLILSLYCLCSLVMLKSKFNKG